MKNLLALGLLLAALPALALGSAPQMYKWTDADGVLHFSDQPPPQPVANLQTQDIPQFPPVDPAKVAAEQTALTAQLTALQRLLNLQADQQAREKALAAQKAELEAEAAALQQQQSEDTERVPLIYSDSRFIPYAFRANLYLHHHKHTPPLQIRIPEPASLSFKP